MDCGADGVPTSAFATRLRCAGVNLRKAFLYVVDKCVSIIRLNRYIDNKLPKM